MYAIIDTGNQQEKVEVGSVIEVDYIDDKKKGDKVKVISGKDKGKISTIVTVNVSNSSVVLEDVNIITKHVKKTDKSEGGQIKLPAPIHWSNISHIDADEKLSKISFVLDKNGNKQRVYKTTKKELSES